MSRDRLPWLFALAAVALLASVGVLVASSFSPRPGAGFEQRVTAGLRCDGAPVASFVREPFVREERSAAPQCIQWTASFVARTRMHARIETMTEGTSSVSLDGHAVVADEDARSARSKVGGVDLGKGVHSFVVTFRGQGGPAYLRVGMVDDLDPHDFVIVPPLADDDFYVSDTDAERALAAPPRERTAWSALLAIVQLASAGLLVWLAVRVRRGLRIPVVDLSLAAGLFGAALFVRAHALDRQDVSWDEGVSWAGRHYFHNLMLGDFFAEAWRHNLEHGPITKWLMGFGDLLGGLDGVRVVMAVLSSVAVGLLFGFGRLAFGRGVGLVAGALGVVLPLWVAHGRIAGHESVVLFCWCCSMLALACWMSDARDGGRGGSLAAFMCVFAATLGVFARPTGIWIFPVLGVAWLLQRSRTRPAIGQRRTPFPFAAIAGGVTATALTVAAWPLVWSDPADKLARASAHWGQNWGDIEVYMGKLRLPAAHYFVVAFLSETPALLLVAGLAGIVLTLRGGALQRNDARLWGIVCLLLLVLPFGQSLSTLRIGAGRYVIQAWPALLVFAAVALVALGDFAAGLAFDMPRRLRAVARALPAMVTVAYTGYALARVEPYPLDYFNELVGGPAGVAARKMFEVPWWGEGNLAAIRALNATAPQSARVHLALWPQHVLARLRDDLVPVDDATLADFVLVSHLQYFAKGPEGCKLEERVEVAGAPLVDTYRCTPVSPTQLGFAAMNRANGADEAVKYFGDALRLDPGDVGALFGLGWASQVKGDLPRAESLYLRAASRAAQVNDADTEYFARFDLGTLYRQRGQNDQAADAFRGAIIVTDRAPDRFADRTWNAWFNLGHALALGGHDAEARTALLHALSVRPGEPVIVDALRALALPADAGSDAR